MNRAETHLALAVGGILLAAAVQADVSEPAANPYQVIIERNPFGLKPPPPIVNKDPTNVVIPVNVKFTGITSKSTNKVAWFVIPAQPGKNPNPQLLRIPEHEKQGDIEVLEINEKESMVKILNAGALVELNPKDNGMPTPTSLAVPGAPLIPHGGPGALPIPGVAPAPGTAPPGFRAAGGLPSGVAVPDPARYGLQPPTAAGNAGLKNIPLRNVRTTPVESPIQGSETPVDPANQYIQIKVNEEKARREGKLPPPGPWDQPK